MVPREGNRVTKNGAIVDPYIVSGKIWLLGNAGGA